MSTQTKTRHQERWEDVTSDPSLQDLPYKVETNAQGQIILSPHSTHHALQQYALQKRLEDVLGRGSAITEFPVATSAGVRVPDVIWASDERMREMRKTGAPTMLAPEICVEVMSPAHSEAEMEAKRKLYREAGADEVWLVSEDGEVRFFAEEELDASALAPDFPNTYT